MSVSASSVSWSLVTYLHFRISIFTFIVDFHGCPPFIIWMSLHVHKNSKTKGNRIDSIKWNKEAKSVRQNELLAFWFLGSQFFLTMPTPKVSTPKYSPQLPSQINKSLLSQRYLMCCHFTYTHATVRSHYFQSFSHVFLSLQLSLLPHFAPKLRTHTRAAPTCSISVLRSEFGPP